MIGVGYNLQSICFTPKYITYYVDQVFLCYVLILMPIDVHFTTVDVEKWTVKRRVFEISYYK